MEKLFGVFCWWIVLVFIAFIKVDLDSLWERVIVGAMIATMIYVLCWLIACGVGFTFYNWHFTLPPWV